MRLSVLLKFIFSLIGVSSIATAQDWDFSIAYNNPPEANLGLNLQYHFSNWALELGVGAVNAALNSSSIYGDVNFKYLFMSGAIRPYLGAGKGFGIGASSGSVGGRGTGTGAGAGAGIGAGAGRFFVDGGVMLEGSTLIGYGAVDYLINSQDFVPVIGIGFKF